MRRISLAGAALALALAAGTVLAGESVPQAVAAPAPRDAPAAATAVPAVLAPAAVPLSAAEMHAARGDGLWTAFKRLIKKTVKVVVGIIRWIWDFIEDLPPVVVCMIDGPGCPDGGETLEATETTTVHYASEADYQAGIASGSSYDQTGWVQTSVWYGGGGGGGGGCGGGSDPYSLIEYPVESCSPYMY